MLLKTVIKKIESKYPLNLAYDWDNVGLLVGDFDMNVEKILVVLEAKKNRAIHDCEFFAESTDKKDDKKNKLVTYKESGFEIVKKVASVVELNIGKNI